MRGSRVAAVIAFVLTAHCLPIPRPADAAGPVTGWYRQGNEWVPIMSFGDAEACARAAQALAAKSGAYLDCADGTLPDSAIQMGRADEPKHEQWDSADRRDHRRQGHPTISCSLTGLTAVCKTY